MEPFRLERYFSRYEFNTEFLLCSSDCESFSIQELLSFERGATENFAKVKLGYTETAGSSELRFEISNTYTTIKPEQVLVHSGGEEVIYVFLRSFLKAGDHVIIPSPSYQSYSEIPLSMGCTVSAWEMKREADKWVLDLDDLKALITSKTKLLIINFPNNPTGYYPSLDFYQRIFDITYVHSITVFSDEAYRDSEYRPEDKLPNACDIDPTAVSLGLLSKAYGMAGLRIGWLATRSQNILSQASRYKDYTSICNSAPSEFLGTIAVRNRSAILQRNMKIMLANRSLLDNFFLRHSKIFSWFPPDAGPVGFPQVLTENVDDFCDQVVKGCGVLLLPGSVYQSSDNCFRIGFGRRNMPTALERLERYLYKK